MTAPVRLQLSRRAGFRLQVRSLATNGLPAVKVARPSVFGNPFTVAEAIDVGYRFKDQNDAQEFCVECFENWVDGSDKCWTGEESDRKRAALLEALPTLRGKNLACWCRESTPCHGETLLRLANK